MVWHAASFQSIALPAGTDLVGELESTLKRSRGPFTIDGFGEVRDPLLWVKNDSGERAEVALTGEWDLVSLKGGGEDAGALTLMGVVHRGSEGRTVAGVLVSATVVSGWLTVLGPSPGAETAQLVRPATATALAPPPTTPGPPQPAAPSAAAPSPPPPEPTPSPAPALVNASASPPQAGKEPPPFGSSGTLPKRPTAVDTSLDRYPEDGDEVNHFAFGHCVVLSSDGERLRLQQVRDSRVREVAISMLAVEEAAPLESGKRTWELRRKR